MKSVKANWSRPMHAVGATAVSRFLAGLFLATLAVPATVAAEDKFDIPAPANLGSEQRLTLWSTYYYVFSARPVSGGNKLLDLNGQDLGVALSSRDWCGTAVEGTVAV